MATEILRKGFVNKNGEKVQLFPAPHEHPISEVKGLNEALVGLSDSFEALANGKQDKLTFDATPTEGSDNPVTSSGVKTALDNKMPASYIPDRVECVDDAGRVVVFLFKSESRGMVARIYIKNEGEEELLAEIDAANIPNLIRALANPDSTPTDNSDNLVTSGGVKRALENKTSISHEDMDSIVKVEVKHVGDDEYDQAKVIGKDRIVMGVGENAEDGSVIIDANNIGHLIRVLTNPNNEEEYDGTDVEFSASEAIDAILTEGIHRISYQAEGKKYPTKHLLVVYKKFGKPSAITPTRYMVRQTLIDWSGIHNRQKLYIDEELTEPDGDWTDWVSIPSATGNIVEGSDKALTSGGAYDALLKKANYYAGQLTIRNEGQSGFPIDGVQGIEENLDNFIALTTADAKYHAMVGVYKDSTLAEFPCLISWTESNNTKTVTILVSHYTFTASRDDNQGGQWDQEFTVVNNSSFFEVL